MKDEKFKDEVTKILEEAPNARKALKENYENLLNVADYCYNTYTQVGAIAVTIKLTLKHLNNCLLRWRHRGGSTEQVWT